MKQIKGNPPSKFKAVINGKCPRCRRGKIYTKPAYHLQFFKMNKNCPHCDYKYEIEPGFFWGAMYVNYALSVALAVVTGVLVFSIYDNPGAGIVIGWITAVLILFTPPMARLSRIITIHFFSLQRFIPELYNKHTEKHN